jgi:hypothetical protein
LLIDGDVVMRGGVSWRDSEDLGGTRRSLEWLGETGRGSEKLGVSQRNWENLGGRVQKKLPKGLDSFL